MYVEEMKCVWYRMHVALKESRASPKFPTGPHLVIKVTIIVRILLGESSVE